MNIDEKFKLMMAKHIFQYETGYFWYIKVGVSWPSYQKRINKAKERYKNYVHGDKP